MKRKLLIILISVIAAISQAQVDSTYGFARTSGSPETIYLAKINPSTGIVTNISHAYPDNELLADATIDPFLGIYYYVAADSIVGLSLLTGNVVSSELITNVNGTYFDQLLFDCEDSSLYGLARTSASPETIYLAKINPSTGIVTNISRAYPDYEVDADATIDPFNKIYYYVAGNGGSDSLIGLSLPTGNVVSKVLLTNVNGTYFDQLIFNCEDSTFYGFARTSSSPETIYLAKVNPSTGIVTNISHPYPDNELDGDVTIDPFTKTYYYIAADSIVGLNLSTGNIVSSKPLTNINGTYFDRLLFNPTYCFGNQTTDINKVSNTSEQLTLYPNPANSSLTIAYSLSNAAQEVNLIMYDVLGNKAANWSLPCGASSNTIVNENISSLEPGMYFYTIFEDNKSIQRGKLVIER